MTVQDHVQKDSLGPFKRYKHLDVVKVAKVAVTTKLKHLEWLLKVYGRHQWFAFLFTSILLLFLSCLPSSHVVRSVNSNHTCKGMNCSLSPSPFSHCKRVIENHRLNYICCSAFLTQNLCITKQISALSFSHVTITCEKDSALVHPIY